jgi:hypothetical protein
LRAVPYAGKVYNLQVEGDPTYTVENIIVHNCSYIRPPDMYMDPDLEMAQQTDLRQDQGDIAEDTLEQQDPDALLECELCGKTVPDADGVTPSLGQPAATPPGQPPAASESNPPGATPQNPAQDPQAPPDPKATKPQGAELGDAPMKPPDAQGPAPTPPNNADPDKDKPPAGGALPKKKDGQPGEDDAKKSETKADPNQPDPAPDDKANPFAKKDDADPTAKDPDAKPDDGSNPFAKKDDADPTAKPGDDAKPEKPKASDQTPKKDGEPCPDCGGKLTKPTKDNPLGATEAVPDPDGDGDNDLPGSTNNPDKAADEKLFEEGKSPADPNADPDAAPADPAKDDGDPAKKDDDDKKDSGPPWLKDKKSKLIGESTNSPEGVSSMAARPVIAAVQEQQGEIERLKAQNQWLYAAVNRLATVAGLRPVTADEKNPANPIPSPGEEAPFSTTDQARAEGTEADVAAIGGVPGETAVAADSTTTVDSIGGISADHPYNVGLDVTQPTSGTDGHIPLDQVRTVPQIEFGNPLKPDAAFPLQGEWAGRATVGSAERSFAAIRLARLRVQAGISTGDDMVLAQAISSNANLTDGAIASEIETLSSVVKAQGSRTASAAPVRRVVASAQPRAIPSMASVPSLSTTASASDEDFSLFE